MAPLWKMLAQLAVPDAMALAMIAAGVATFVTLVIIQPAPYGRYSRPGWGFFIPSRLAWVTQEVWSLAVPAVSIPLFATEAQWQRLSCPANLAAMAAFLTHYVYRDIIYPARMRPGKPTPFSVWLMAAAFCMYNGSMQTSYFLTRAPAHAPLSTRVVLGLALWAVGFSGNVHSDSILRNLRKPGRAGYSVPRGGLFELVSAANYFAEIVEWLGWSVAVDSAPAYAFAFFTAANLVPRGVRHHHWYHATFKNYPRERWAIIPCVL